jgi:pyrroloquinoline quinone biosynthesis protein B
MVAAASVLLLACPNFAQEAQPPFLVVLGIAQDGGYPQAGSKPDHAAWRDPSQRRLVSCLGLVDPVSGQRWLFDATPDFKEQLHRFDVASPHAHTPGLDGIFLTHAHVGHYTGLVHLGKEILGTAGVPVWAMPRMHGFLTGNGPWSQLVELGNIDLRRLHEGESVQLNDRLTVTPVSVPHRDEFSETVGFLIEGPSQSIFFLPDIDKWQAWDETAGDGALERILERVDVAYLDGSFYADGEVPGREMSEIRHPFISESLERLAGSSHRDKIRFIHLNRTNPAIVDGSEAQLAVRRAGFRLAREGERVDL